MNFRTGGTGVGSDRRTVEQEVDCCTVFGTEAQATVDTTVVGDHWTY